MSMRDKILARLKEDIIGPGPDGELEKIYERPSERYLTGILYPQGSEISAEDDDQLSKGQEREEENSLETGVSLFRATKPSTAGLSFAVDKACQRISIKIECGVYKCREEINVDSEKTGAINSSKLSNENPLEGENSSQSNVKKHKWERQQISRQLYVKIPNSITKLTPNDTELPGLTIHIRVRKYQNKVGLTVQAVNSSELRKSELRKNATVADREEASFFQFGISIRTDPPGNLVPRPIITQPRDADGKTAALIFRNVKEYATGHTTAASWELDDNDFVKEIKTTWLPMEKVPAVDPAGDEIFQSEYSAQGMEMPDAHSLSQCSPNDLILALKPLPDAYKKWIDQQSNKIKDISDDSLQETAQENLKTCEKICKRINEGIALLEKEPTTCQAFQLANEAMQIQACWKNGAETGVPRGNEDKLKWRPFQLGFALLSLASLTDVSHRDRDLMDLIWFPTGGGKTEAYLLVAAYVLFLRRLHPKGTVSHYGTSVLMRYTLRTLTIQQFERASALICACEHIRNTKNINLGEERFSIALWVGGASTPNRVKEAKKALDNPEESSTPEQLKKCPGCHEPLCWKCHENTIKCLCENASCVLSGDSGLPVKTVDEVIYASPSSLVIGTVDKFAQIIRLKEVSTFFGTNGKSLPPDLIIQDELHLITGPLGSLVGLFECAIDALCSHNGTRPKVIGSTATIRRATEQIKNLFNRRSAQFPPPAIDEKNNCFAKTDKNSAGRLYIGITTAGRSDKFSLQATIASLLQTGAEFRTSSEFDPYGTIVAYFNSLRILGGALVAIQDDVLKSMSAYAKRRKNETRREIDEPEELTSRKASREIPDILGKLGIKFGEAGCIDVLLASNMLSVGVDIPRLGLMVVNGQPKTVSEYIQATSRVGRGQVEGLVVTLYNHQKTRDRSRYETFKTWHQALYRDVEGASVTPFAPRARDKAFHAVLVAIARHLIPDFPSSGRIDSEHCNQIRKQIFPHISKWVNKVDSREHDSAMTQLEEFLCEWEMRSENLKYIWSDKYHSTSLLVSAETAASRHAAGLQASNAKPTPNSMRNVEPSVDFRGREYGQLKNENTPNA